MIIGHQKIITFLNKSIANNKLAHAYLFTGSEHLGKRTVALEFAKALQCRNKKDSKQNKFLASACNQCRSCQDIQSLIHPDVLLLEPERTEERGKIKEKEISIEQVRNIQQQLSLFPYYGPYKIVIIDRSERMTREAANALLKTLEEPTAKTILILLSSAPQNLLPTIISRCLLVKFFAVSHRELENYVEQRKDIKLNKESLRKIIRLTVGKPGMLLNYLENPEIIREQNLQLQELIDLLKKDLIFRFKYVEKMTKDINLANQLLSLWTIFFRDLILYKTSCQQMQIFDFRFDDEKVLTAYTPMRLKDILSQIIATKNILNNTSFNARLALEVLMLNL